MEFRGVSIGLKGSGGGLLLRFRIFVLGTVTVSLKLNGSPGLSIGFGVRGFMARVYMICSSGVVQKFRGSQARALSFPIGSIRLNVGT